MKLYSNIIAPKYSNTEEDEESPENSKKLMNAMKEQIDTIREEFMGTLKDIKNKTEHNSVIEDRNLKLDFSGTGQSYISSKVKPEQLTLDVNYNKECAQKNDSDRISSYFGRSSSVQNAHKTLFYKHAFNDNNKGDKYKKLYKSKENDSDTP